MRQLKFRAWDKENKRMYQPCFVWGDIQPANGLPLREFVNEFRDEWMYGGGDIVLEQWTGLQDKAGKDIYEGDIVLALCSPCMGRKNTHKCVVKYSADFHGFTFPIIDIPKTEAEISAGVKCHATSFLDFGYRGNHFEVIGNIHEKEGDLT